MKIKSALNITTLLSFFFLSFAAAHACSCLRSKPPCGVPGKTSVIFTGEVINITNAPQGRREVQFKVDESFNNVKSRNLIVQTGSGGGDCGYDFKVGEKYLVYAGEYEGKIGTGICSRTRVLADAQDDLEILRQIKLNKPVQSRLFGTAGAFYSGGDRINPTPGIKITARNETGKIYETASDSAGRYRFVNLPIGKYDILAAYKDSFTKNGSAVIKSGNGGQCAEQDFYFLEGGSIKGRVVDNEGKPVAKLTVVAERLISTPEDAENNWSPYGRTDENGNYEIEGLQKGKYILKINDSLIDNEFPYPATFYPGAKTKEQAENIVVTTEKPLSGFNFQLPPKLKLRVITGTAFFTNGKPIAEGRVRAEEESSKRRMDEANIDKEGRFTLRVVEGQSYYLYVYKTWNIPRESKKIYIPKTGEIEPLKIIIHPVQ